MTSCPLCGERASRSTLDEAGWLDPRVVEGLTAAHPRWRREDGACPACIQEALLGTVLRDGRATLESRVQSVWPLDAEAAFGALPTPLRLRADPRFRGTGGTIAFVDAAFFPHPDLVRPVNRIRAWANASSEVITSRWFSPDDVPVWPEAPAGFEGAVWHGLMTSVTAAGNGWLSHGLYRGLAPESGVVLVQVSTGGGITSEAIARALQWLRDHALDLHLRVVSLSVGGDEPAPDEISAVDDEVAALVADGVVVIAAAGNNGVRDLVPPATSPDAITVGGIDDHNVLNPDAWQLWHSNFGTARGNTAKPEVVAPSLWTVAPVLPGSDVADEAHRLFNTRRRSPTPDIDRRIAELRLVTPHYQHVEGTSFAAPVVASVVSCMCEANPLLTPEGVRELLMASATAIANAPVERQGAGVVDAGRAVAAALRQADAQDSSTPRSDTAGA